MAVSNVDYLMFVLRSARRHIWLCLGVTLSVAVLGTAGVLAMPRIYGSTSKIYLQPTNALTSALTGGRRIGESTEKPKPVNAELVVNRANLLSLVREAELPQRWQASRTWPFRLKDRVQAALLGEPTKAEQERVLAQLLEASIFVNNEDQGSVRFTINWREPEGAFLLASLVQRNFFKDWQADELAAITRATSLLQDELARATDGIAPAIRSVQEAVGKVRARTAARQSSERDKAAPVARRVAAPAPLPAAPAVARHDEDELKQIEENRRAQRAVLEPWQHRAAELKFQLAELRATYGPEHPLVRQQEAKVESIGREPEELTRLRAEEAALLAGLTRGSADADPGAPRARTTSSAAAGASGSSVMQYESIRSMVEREQDDPEVSSARIHLESVLAKCRELESRLDAARMELATTQVSFKYRYKVVEPPEVPSKAIKPNRIKLFGIVAGLALVLGLLAGAARELLRGRVLEAWQLRRLGVPVLAEVELRNLRLPR